VRQLSLLLEVINGKRDLVIGINIYKSQSRPRPCRMLGYIKILSKKGKDIESWYELERHVYNVESAVIVLTTVKLDACPVMVICIA